MDFRALPPFDLSVMEDYQRFYELSVSQIADNAPNSRYAWRSIYNYRVLKTETCLTLVSPGGPYCGPHFAHPLGAIKAHCLDEAVGKIRSIFEAEGWPLRAFFVDEKDLPLYQEAFGLEIKVSDLEKYADYLYDGEALRSLKGKALRSKRNHVNRFWRDWPQAKLRPLLQADMEEAMALVEAWSLARDIDPQAPDEGDSPAIRELFEAMDQLDVKGMAIEIQGRLVAFAMGSLNSHGLGIVHFEKADASYEGIYAVINQAMAQGPFKAALWINREEDMGLPGIRKAKQSYKPIRMIRKLQIDF